MKGLTVVALIAGAALTSCNKAPAAVAQQHATPPPRPQVTRATFEPVYRSAKALQGATASGISYVKFGELLQGLSIEIGIAKDHALNDADKRLLAAYQKVYADYQASALLWKTRIDAHGEAFQDTIPVELKGTPIEQLAEIAHTYDLPITPHKVPYTGVPFKSVPGDSAQRVWVKASSDVDEATEIYYGRQ